MSSQLAVPVDSGTLGSVGHVAADVVPSVVITRIDDQEIASPAELFAALAAKLETDTEAP